jgi:hypothetical protein
MDVDPQLSQSPLGFELGIGLREDILPTPRPQHHHYSHDQPSIAAGFAAALAYHIVTALIIQIQFSSMLALKRIQPEYRRDTRYYIAYLFIVNYIRFELEKKSYCFFDR